MTLSHDIRGRIAADPDLWREFEALCDFGGRLSGTESDARALPFLRARGAREDLAAHRGELAGGLALVRHELMSGAGTAHRRRKYLMAREAGGVGFLIAGPVPGALVAGPSGRDGGDGTPTAGIMPETA